MAGRAHALYGILGWPIEHSLSPAMQQAAFGALGLEASYVPCAVTPEALGDAVRGLRALGFSGVNVTVPHKQAVLNFIDEVDADARAIGAVNTIVRRGERLIGYNTDAPGFVASLVEAGFTSARRKVVVLGAGGAARALVVGLTRASASYVAIAARRVDQAQALVDDLQGACPSTSLEAVELGRDELTRVFTGGVELLVQSTSATLHGAPEAAAFCAQLPLAALPAQAVVVDIVYNPLETALLRAARQRGLRTVDGVGMLVHQGALAFKLWTGHDAPIEAMRNAVLTRLAAPP